MKLNRLAAIAACLTVAVTVIAAFKERDDDEDTKERPGFFPILHQNHPRVFGIFSKPPEKDAPKQTGPGIIGHIGNVLHGGTIGIELSARPLGALLDHAKKIIPGGRGTVGQPHYEKPTYEKPHEPPHHEKPHELPHHEKPHEPPHKEWEMKKPEKELMKEPMKEPEPEGYNWDDIGEEIERFEASTEVPIEDLINPRVRPKRFIESKIYHVPLTFRSNGKAFKVWEKTRNSIESKGNKM